MAKPVDQAAELLYGLPLDEFTTARNAAAKELRDRGLKAEAEEVKAFAKPTVPAWAVNQLGRRRHADLDELLDAATAAREAQLGGGPDAREAIKRLRDALDGLVDAARDELGGKASEAVLGKVRQTLERAGADTSQLEFVALDLMSDKGWAQAMAGVRYVQHVASPFVTSMPADKMDLLRPAVEGTTRALEAAFTAEVERIVGKVVKLPADRDRLHLVGAAGRGAGAPEQHERALAQQ